MRWSWWTSYRLTLAQLSISSIPHIYYIIEIRFFFLGILKHISCPCEVRFLFKYGFLWYRYTFSTMFMKIRHPFSICNFIRQAIFMSRLDSDNHSRHLHYWIYSNVFKSGNSIRLNHLFLSVWTSNWEMSELLTRIIKTQSRVLVFDAGSTIFVLFRAFSFNSMCSVPLW